MTRTSGQIWPYNPTHEGSEPWKPDNPSPRPETPQLDVNREHSGDDFEPTRLPAIPWRIP